MAQKKFVNITQGEDKAIPLRLVDTEGDPFVLDANVTEIKARFKGDNPDCIEVFLTTAAIVITNIDGGKLTVNLITTETFNLIDGELLNFEVEVLKGGKVFISQFLGKLNVFKQICAL